MYREAIDIIAKYVEEAINGTRGNVTSISVKQINKWYKKRFGRPMSRKIAYRIAKLLRVLHALGILQKIGSKFIVERDSQLWKCVKEGRTRECISEYATKFAKLVVVA